MKNEPTKQRLDKIPRLFETGLVPFIRKRIHLKFFC